jgi:hypothetical protein
MVRQLLNIMIARLRVIVGILWPGRGDERIIEGYAVVVGHSRIPGVQKEWQRASLLPIDDTGDGQSLRIDKYIVEIQVWMSEDVLCL